MAKIILGILSWWPLFYIGLLIAGFFAMVFIFTGVTQIIGWYGYADFAVMLNVVTWALLLPPSILLTAFIIVLYIIDIFKNPGIDKDKKLRWILLLVLLFFISLPAYWYRFIWNSPQVQPPTGQS